MTYVVSIIDECRTRNVKLVFLPDFSGISEQIRQFGCSQKFYFAIFPEHHFVNIFHNILHGYLRRSRPFLAFLDSMGQWLSCVLVNGDECGIEVVLCCQRMICLFGMYVLKMWKMGEKTNKK